jgi:hypothetical protein
MRMIHSFPGSSGHRRLYYLSHYPLDELHSLHLLDLLPRRPIKVTCSNCLSKYPALQPMHYQPIPRTSSEMN